MPEFPRQLCVAILLSGAGLLLCTVVQDVLGIWQRARMAPWQRSAIHRGRKRGFEVLPVDQPAATKLAQTEPKEEV